MPMRLDAIYVHARLQRPFSTRASLRLSRRRHPPRVTKGRFGRNVSPTTAGFLMSRPGSPGSLRLRSDHEDGISGIGEFAFRSRLRSFVTFFSFCSSSSLPFLHSLCARLTLSSNIISRYIESPLPCSSLSVFTRFAVRSFFLSLLFLLPDLPLSLSAL